MRGILVWLRETQTGDRAELNLHSSVDAAWSKLAAEKRALSADRVPLREERDVLPLPGQKRADAAHVLVVNHALLLSDMATGGHVLPPYEHLIIDEAHNLEDEATSRFAFKATEADFNDFLDRVGRRTGERAGGLAGSIDRGVARRLGDLMGPGRVPGRRLSSLVAATTRAASNGSPTRTGC